MGWPVGWKNCPEEGLCGHRAKSFYCYEARRVRGMTGGVNTLLTVSVVVNMGAHWAVDSYVPPCVGPPHLGCSTVWRRCPRFLLRQRAGMLLRRWRRKFGLRS